MMNPITSQKTVAQFGSWKSPISTDLIVADSVRLGQLRVMGSDIWWTEGRPRQEGKTFLVRSTADGGCCDMTDAAFNVKSRANEYGGGDFLLADGLAYFCNNEDQRIYRLLLGEKPLALTMGGAFRYADAIHDARRRRLIAVREDHTDATREAVYTLVAIDLATGQEMVLQSGCDFYSSPRLDRAGSSLAWLSWNHPEMPWDGTQLWCAGVNDDGTLQTPTLISGGANESIFQPEWSPDGVLHFVSDRSGWWNLYRQLDGQAQALCPMAAEFGEAQWIFGMSTYAITDDGRVICSYLQNGRAQLAVIDVKGSGFEPIPTPFHTISDVQVGPGFVAFSAGSPSLPKCIVKLDLQSHAWKILRKANDIAIDDATLSTPEAIEFPTENGVTAHAFFYSPRNADFQGPPDARPPLLVMTHGGPTAMTNATLNVTIQYWTSRGFAVVDVNYGGSSGYGRTYRQRLNGQWGVVDVDDAVNAARYLVQRGEVDGGKLAIRGSSAGGYTTLCALTFRKVFSAGASYYGIGDLETLAGDTHKFESRYMDSMVGPYPSQKQTYFERSPINFIEQLDSPLILFQGLKDKVVPPNQAQSMFDAVKAKGLPVAYICFEEEGHGFRQAANIKRSLDAELYFYGKVFGFAAADKIDAVQIENLPG
jgi:dipeptidyl aminopeptidase/acylaminoacyl peptidase